MKFKVSSRYPQKIKIPTSLVLKKDRKERKTPKPKKFFKGDHIPVVVAVVISRSCLITKNKLDLCTGEQMQICIHRKDNSPKPVNQHLTLKEGPKVKSNHTTRFPAHDFLYVSLPSQTSRANNKRVISTFKFGYLRLTLKEGPKVKSDHIKRFLAPDFQ